MSSHIVNGQFQSDKYPWCKPGFVPLKLTDPLARKVLMEYAYGRAAKDVDFSTDLIACIQTEEEKVF